uniref:Uncharacterized protein n=1 Tax=viral metagenome TaxID=1070528 RepID=A0A6H1ZWI4_9ZZZZ
MDIWMIFDKYLSNIVYPYKKTIRRDVEGKYLYNEIRDVVIRHFPLSFRIEQVKRGVYYIAINRDTNFSMANMIYNCLK